MPQFSPKKVQRYLEFAKSASYNSDFPRHKLGACFVFRGAVLANGWNQQKTSPLQKKYNEERDYDTEACYTHTNCLHAEVSCLNKIKDLDIQFDKGVLYIYREHRNNHKALAKPCLACEAMIRDLGIKDVVYTTENGYAIEHFD